MSNQPLRPLLITLGEPAGIGPDCVLQAFQEEPALFDGTVVAAPANWLTERAGVLEITPDIHVVESPNNPVPEGKLGCWNPLPPERNEPVIAGQPSSTTAAAVIHCIETAARACMNGDAAALVTAPIEKAILRNSGFNFPGHTEFLAHLANKKRVVMMLASDTLRVALLTTHLPLRDVPDILNSDHILHDLRTTCHDLKYRFAIGSPRLALCGLNPHAGEQGHFGDEEIKILAPAIRQATEEGISVDGPLPADTLFSPQMREHYDAIVCCYHDQALIPIKTLSFGEAVNVTLGLPFIRTSVDHGTALERAGTGKISYSSIMAAIKMARMMAGNESGGDSDADQ